MNNYRPPASFKKQDEKLSLLGLSIIIIMAYFMHRRGGGQTPFELAPIGYHPSKNKLWKAGYA